jgi:hypothetical protein
MGLLSFKLIRGYNNEINLNMRTVEVREGRRTIRAQWNPEIAQDIVFYHGIEAELTRILSEEIGREINREIMERIGLGVQRVFDGTIAQELVPVQPLGGPTGILHCLDYKYDTLKIFKLLRG